jgi:Lysozyme like domain
MAHHRRRIRFGSRRISGRQVAAAVGCGALMALAVHHGSTAASAGSAAAGAAMPVSGGGTLSCSGLESLWESAGGSSGTAFMAAEIAQAESSGRQYAYDADGNGTIDRGYWQINSIHGSLSTYDAAGNARAAVELSGDGTDWSPWVTYQTGAYQGRC